MERLPTFVIDCAAMSSDGQFWAAYLDAVQPEGAHLFGRNLHAFTDAVLWGGPGWPGRCVLRLTNSATLNTIYEGRFLDALREIAADAAPTVQIHFE